MKEYRNLRQNVKIKARLFHVKNPKDFDKVIDELFDDFANDCIRHVGFQKW